MRDFLVDNENEQIDTLAPELRPVLRNLFPRSKHGIRERNIEKQKQGIDLYVITPGQLTVTLDFKFRSGVYNDFCLEWGHCDYDGNDRVKGWVNDPKKINDFIAYVFKPVWSCWLLPRQALFNAWQKYEDTWKEAYGYQTTENTSYITWWTAVPIEVICGTVRGISWADQKRTTIAPMVHSETCVCWECLGKLQAWVVESRL
jgi:hypothetical protein